MRLYDIYTFHLHHGHESAMPSDFHGARFHERISPLRHFDTTTGHSEEPHYCSQREPAVMPPATDGDVTISLLTAYCCKTPNAITSFA